MDKVWDILGGILAFIGDHLPNPGAPNQWPNWAFAAIGLLIVMGLSAYVWNRLGRGVSLALMALVAFVVVVAMNVRGG